MTLTNTLRRAPDFEQGARAVLEALLDEVAVVIPGTRPLRAMAHLRPGGSYRSLVVAERGGQNAPDVVPSASAWQALQSDSKPLIIDVLRSRARTLGGTRKDGRGLFSIRSQQTIARLRSRMTTFLIALPLQGHNDELLGAVSIELNSALDGPPDDIVDDGIRQLQAAVDLLALALPGLPVANAPTERNTRDAMMPVVGKRMARVLRLLSVFAQQDETLLLSGETGVGKSQLAAWCHKRSAVRAGPLEAVVLSTLPESMQLPGLFGWKRGAFTGAVKDSPGGVARASGGTLFIDEIDKLSPRAQAGLLQLLESRQYRPVGDPGPLKTANVRFIIGTNIDLAEAVAEGRFLEDLFFRINVLPVQIPPLAQRTDEIEGWVSFMARRRHRKAGMTDPLQVSPAACALLAEQPWPGNLRQLDNAVRRAYAVMLADTLGSIGATVLERRHVEQALSMDLARGVSSRGASVSVGEGMLPPLGAAARALIEALNTRSDQDREAGFSLADAFSTVLLHEALQQTGDLKAAYTLLGRGGLVASRSHHKDFRRRMRRLRDVLERLALPIDDALAASLEM